MHIGPQYFLRNCYIILLEQTPDAEVALLGIINGQLIIISEELCRHDGFMYSGRGRVLNHTSTRISCRINICIFKKHVNQRK
jgi:hypothetical protein